MTGMSRGRGAEREELGYMFFQKTREGGERGASGEG